VANLDVAGSRWLVVTTVQEPTPALQRVIETCRDRWRIVVVGDVTTPSTWARVRDVEYLSLERQLDEQGALARATPTRHYARKNLGYAFAIARGARVILETDDDHWPLEGFGDDVEANVRGERVGGGGWVNPYLHFSEQGVWPRGLPLDAIWQRGARVAEDAPAHCPVQQYLVDGDPDVDAIFRLTRRVRDVRFAQRAPLVFEPGTWSPWNSQHTLWFEDAFPALYLPSHVSFRVTDIWRSLVAQAALWQHGARVAFRAPAARQERNPHALLRDFEEEVPAYLGNRSIARTLARACAEGGSDEPLEATVVRLWSRLVDEGWISERERELIAACQEALASTVAAAAD
jgi:hypothetical protein